MDQVTDQGLSQNFNESPHFGFKIIMNNLGKLFKWEIFK